MSAVRQQILILHLAAPALESDTIAWALYDGATPSGTLPMQSGDSYEIPYPSVLEAMRDGEAGDTSRQNQEDDEDDDEDDEEEDEDEDEDMNE